MKQLLLIPYQNVEDGTSPISFDDVSNLQLCDHHGVSYAFLKIKTL